MNIVPSSQFVATFVSDSDVFHGSVAVTQGVVAGWNGRDPEAVEKHIRELEEIGVPRPPRIPIYYRVAASRFTTAPIIEVCGEASSGEAEYVLLQTRGRLWVGVGSDHTDRQVETYDITVSKQMCEKPVATTFWAFSDVADHWDQLRLAARIREDGRQVVYQDGMVSGLRPPLDTIREFTEAKTLPEGTMMMCGTLSVQGAIRAATQFSFSLEDPVRGRRIEHSYEIRCLPFAR